MGKVTALVHSGFEIPRGNLVLLTATGERRIQRTSEPLYKTLYSGYILLTR